MAQTTKAHINILNAHFVVYMAIEMEWSDARFGTITCSGLNVEDGKRPLRT